MNLRTMVASILFFGLVNAAPKSEWEFFVKVPEMTELQKWNDDEYKEVNKEWKKSNRKIASEFTAKDRPEDFETKILIPWLDAKNSEGIANLLNKSYQEYSTYSPGSQYFLAQLHMLIPLRGIVWRLRPLFETGSLFKGNRATHLSAIQFVRTFATGVTAAFPTVQTEALIGYLTKPGKEMTEVAQFKTMEQFQNFLINVFVRFAKENAERMKTILKNNPLKVWAWDNRMFFGTASFKSGFNQYVGHGAVEMHMAIGSVWEAIHDAYVFSAYNQNDLIAVAGSLGNAFGIDVLKDKEFNEIGLTDKERNKIISNYSKKKNGFLSIRKFNPTQKKLAKNEKDLGAGYMQEAFKAKTNAINEFNEAYAKLGKNANPSMAINPILYSKDVQNRLDQGIVKMASAVKGVTEFVDPISTEVVTLDVPNFYANPPESLYLLMANNWEDPKKEATVVRNYQGIDLHYRDYFSGRAISWNNKEWVKYVPSVPSGEGEETAKYMQTAKRVLHYSLGASPVFGVVDIFVR